MKIIVIIITCLLFFSGAVSAAEELFILEDAVTIIKQDSVVVGQDEYLIVTEEMAVENPELTVTEYWYGDKERHQTDFNTIYGVGYIDMAKVTIDNIYVRKIDIITLMQ